MPKKPEDRSPLPDAARTVYFDADGVPYYTEWQLVPPAERDGPAKADISDVGDEDGRDGCKAA